MSGFSPAANAPVCARAEQLAQRVLNAAPLTSVHEHFERCQERSSMPLIERLSRLLHRVDTEHAAGSRDLATGVSGPVARWQDIAIAELASRGMIAGGEPARLRAAAALANRRAVCD